MINTDDSFISNIIFSCLQYQDLVVPDSVFKQTYSLFSCETIKYLISVEAHFTINIEFGP